MGGLSALEVVPATPDRWTDIAALLGGDGERGCWCQAWRGRDDLAKALDEARPVTLRRQLQTSFPPPGYLADLDGVAVGWLGIGIRSAMPRLRNSRTIPAVDDLPVWSVGCLCVRPGHQRRGVATRLLAAVVEEARNAGAPGVEAYPIDPGGRRVDVSLAYVGIVSMFDAAGFRRVRETDAVSAGLPRLLVRIDFGSA